MGLFKRIGDIISANLSEMAEQYEDPEMMLKQAIREMETSINQATQETAKAMASQKLLAKELAHNEGQARDWQHKAEQAVEAGDDERAKQALTRKQEHDKLARALRDQLSAAEDASASLRTQLEGMKAKLAEAKRNLATLSARQKAADFRKKMETQAACPGTADDDAFAKFDRLRERVEQAEAEAEAMAELRGGKPAGGGEPGTPAAETDLEAQLRELKRKKGK